jgi:hypothetical protein
MSWFERASGMTRHKIRPGMQAVIYSSAYRRLKAMNVPEWLEGYGGPEIFHHKQIDRVIGQLKDQDIK